MTAVLVGADHAVLSAWRPGADGYFFDRAGRLLAAYEAGWYLSHSLSGELVAKRWNQGEREIRRLPASERGRLRRSVIDLLQTIGSDIPEPSLHVRDASVRAGLTEWIDKARGFSWESDPVEFQTVYRPIGILPPDQYNSCVVQVTESCSWNQCSFCWFYRDQPYRLKDPAELQSHIRSVRSLLREGLSARSAVFLGAANALAAPREILFPALDQIQRELVPEMSRFRGICSFIEPADCAYQTVQDFQELRSRGLRRLYFGLETGSASLRRRLRKPSELAALERHVRVAKAADLEVALILLTELGGAEHVRESADFISGLPLDSTDRIYLSPLHGSLRREDGGTLGQFRRTLQGPARLAVYDIREALY